MNIDRWKDTLDIIREKFEIEDEGVLESEEYGGSKTDYIIFIGPLGKMKLELVSKPKILDRKTHYSNRIGSEVDVEYVYSDTEMTSQLMVARWSDLDQNWLPLDANNLQF
jgi:hypothetical protein